MHTKRTSGNHNRDHLLRNRKCVLMAVRTELGKLKEAQGGLRFGG